MDARQHACAALADESVAHVLLGHFLSAMSMYWIAEAVYTHTDAFGLFGIPDVSELRLRVSAFVFAVV